MAQNISLMGASYPDVPSVVLPKTGGGTAIFADPSITTAAESDVASGKKFLLPDGSEGTGTASGGGGASTATGTFTGGGGITAQISCDFAPDLIYIYGDLSGSASLRGIVSLTIVKDSMLLATSDGSQSAIQESLNEAYHGITGYNENNQVDGTYATYSNNTLAINTVQNTSTRRFASGVTYSYKLVGWS